MKKLLKGDGQWSTTKELLGWLVDTVAKTVSLTTRKGSKLLQRFDFLRGKKRTSLKQWQKFIGELRSMVLAIPGGRGLFSALQHGLTHSDKSRVRITPHIRNYLDDLEHLARDLANRPTRIAEIIPDNPVLLNAVDASKSGMGGVSFSRDHAPILWREPFSPAQQAALITDANPSGTITISDMEQAAIIAQDDLNCQLYDLREQTSATASDNTPAVGRCNRGCTTTTDAAAYLSRLHSLHQRHYRYNKLTSHIPGVANVMADDCSRLWQLSDSQLLSHFEQHYPQSRSWKLCQLRPALKQALTCSLLKQPADLPSLLDAWHPATVSGLTGKNFVIPSDSPARYKTCPKSPSSPSSPSMPSDTVMDVPPAVVNPSELTQWMKPYEPSVRRSPAWGSPILASSLAARSNPASLLSSDPSAKPTPPQIVSTPPLSKSSSRSWLWRPAMAPPGPLPLPTSDSSVSSSSSVLASTLTPPATKTTLLRLPWQTPISSLVPPATVGPTQLCRL